MVVTIFGIKLTLNPIAFTIPLGKSHWDVYWYGIIIAIGFALALFYAYKNAKRFDINLDKLLDVVIITAPISILCARSYYLIFAGEKLESVSDAVLNLIETVLICAFSLPFFWLERFFRFLRQGFEFEKKFQKNFDAFKEWYNERNGVNND